MAFNSSKVPISTQALTLSSVTSPAGNNLTLTSGLVGTNKVNFPDTLTASSSTAGAVTIGNGTAATNVAIGGGNINAGGYIVQSPAAAASVANYLLTNGSNNSSTTNLNPGVLVFSNGNSIYGMDLGHNGTAFRTRVFAPTNVALSVYNQSGTFTQSQFVDALVASSTGVTISSSTAGSSGAGALVVTGGLSAGGASFFGGSETYFQGSTGNTNLIFTRAGTSNGATIQYKTGATLKWYHGLRGLVNDNFYVHNQSTDVSVLVLDVATNAATFAGAVTAPSVTAATTLADQGGTIAAQRNGLAPRQGLVYDGTASSTVANVPAFGMADFTVALVFNPSSTAGLIGGNASSFTLQYNGSNLTAGKVNVVDLTAGGATITQGLNTFVTYRRTGGQGYYGVNGVEALPITDGQDYTVATNVLGARIGGTDVLTGKIGLIGIYNRALSAAEVLALYQ
jgi:hypothetical protein